MPTSWDSVNTLCPFYLTEGSHTITCEGLACQSDLHDFIIRANKNNYKSGYCNSCYRKCPYYKALLDYKYPEKENMQRKLSNEKFKMR